MVHGRHGRSGARWPLIGLGGLGAVAAVIVVAIGIGQVTGGRACAAVVPAAAATAGTATHYVLSGTGNCSYPSPPADGLFVALSPAEYHGAAACGGYIEVSGPHGSVRAEVIDQHGLFCELYTDRGSHYFHTPKAGEAVSKSVQTPVGRALAQLGIRHIAPIRPRRAAS